MRNTEKNMLLNSTKINRNINVVMTNVKCGLKICKGL